MKKSSKTNPLQLHVSSDQNIFKERSPGVVVKGGDS